jgi:predicted HicB family RNase H-like nuclease
MSKNIKIDERVHIRLKREAVAKGRLLSHLASELIQEAMDARKKAKP